MSSDDKNLPESGDNSPTGSPQSEPDEVGNKEAKEKAVALIKAELDSQRSFSEKIKEARRQIDQRNIDQKKAKEERLSEIASSPKKLNNEPLKPEIRTDVKKTETELKHGEKPENSGDKRDSSVKNDNTINKKSKKNPINKNETQKLTGKARKNARKRMSELSPDKKTNLPTSPIRKIPNNPVAVKSTENTQNNKNKGKAKIETKMDTNQVKAVKLLDSKVEASNQINNKTLSNLDKKRKIEDLNNIESLEKKIAKIEGKRVNPMEKSKKSTFSKQKKLRNLNRLLKAKVFMKISKGKDNKKLRNLIEK